MIGQAALLAIFVSGDVTAHTQGKDPVTPQHQRPVLFPYNSQYLCDASVPVETLQAGH